MVKKLRHTQFKNSHLLPFAFVRVFKGSKLFICVKYKKSVQQQFEIGQETMENVHAEVEK